jgi:hypothetical protein
MSVDNLSTYYDAGGIEAIDIIWSKLTPEQYRGFLIGNVIKYICRLNFKHDDTAGRLRDIEKCCKYLGLLEDEMRKRG